MLLSEVLNITNNVKSYKPVNEAYKSNIIRELVLGINTFSKFGYPEREFSNMRSYQKCMNISDIVTLYCWLTDINPDLFNTAKGRLMMLNCKWTKKRSFIEEINDSINEVLNKKIDIANIDNESVAYITDISLVKKKGYKEGLLFWVDLYGKLRAITYMSKVIAIINPKSELYALVLNNKNYVGNFTEEECKAMIEQHKNRDYYKEGSEFKEWIKTAFHIVPAYDLYMSQKSIKSELDCLAISINKLIDYFNNNHVIIDKIYCVDSESMALNDITEKMISRAEWRKFTNDLKNIVQQNRRCYKQLAVQAQNNKLKNSNENTLKELYNHLINVTLDLFEASSDILINGTDGKLDTGSKYISIKCESNSYIKPYIIHTYPDNNIFIKFLNTYKSKRGYSSTLEYVTISDKKDLLLYATVYVLAFLYKLKSIMEYYTIAHECEQGINPERLLSCLTTIKEQLTGFSRVLNQTYADYNCQELRGLLTSQGYKKISHDIEDISTKFKFTI